MNAEKTGQCFQGMSGSLAVTRRGGSRNRQDLHGKLSGSSSGGPLGLPQSYDPAHGVIYVVVFTHTDIAVECSVSDSAQKRRLACTCSRRS